MKRKIGFIVGLSIMITGINYPTYNVFAQEENQDISQNQDSYVESELQQENLKENSWRYQDGELIRSEEDEISLLSEVYAPNATRKGIDVSEHNKNIDWEKVKAAGIDYAIIRCGYGSDIQIQDDKQWQ